MREAHRTDTALVFPEILLMQASMFIQDSLGEESFTTNRAAVPPNIGMTIHVIFQTILK